MIAPTIIIGLGGIGSDICCRVSRLVLDEKQRKRIRFVCIDTDINDLARRKEEDPRILTIQTSAPYMVSNYLETNTNARDNWFPNHNILMGKTPTEGAGQVRAISRLAFEEAIREGRMRVLEKAIEELYFLDGASAPQAVRVIIVSTLAGGTGSGIVLPVALYVRHFLETRFRKSASVMRGFFLLPEIMFGNKSPEECGSLCCNAYASMRELDAFMRRGDGALSGPKYRSLKLELPDPSTGGYVDYRVSPFNFCFLYDKRNTDDLQLKSFDDYKEHAANTIYAQAISGMSSRSNSNEDNAIKPLIRSNGRNRFCGAGSSILKYPRDSVLRYVAGKWCEQNMGQDWLYIDQKYLEYLANVKVLRRTNPSLKVSSLPEYYTEMVEQSEKGSFPHLIREMCFTSYEDDRGTMAGESKVDQYTAALGNHLQQVISNDQDLLELASSYSEEHERVNANLAGGLIKGDEKIPNGEMDDALGTLANLCKSYRDAAERAGNRLGRSMTAILFRDENNYTEMDAPYRMEHYMKDEDGKFIHPSAARYFIYSLLLKFQLGRQGVEADLKKQWAELNPFDDLDTAVIEDYSEFRSAHQSRSPLSRGMSNKSRIEALGMIEGQFDESIPYAVNLAKKAIFDAGCKYLQSMAEAFESFYNILGKYLKDTSFEVAELEQRFVNGEGKATRYVCASSRCLRAMLKDMPCTGENSGVNGRLSADIFQEMKVYSMMVRKPNASLYFENLYQNTIMGFWEKRVENNYESVINMDILTALETEADYETDEILTDDQKSRHAAQVLKQAERLAAPFVEEPMGEIRHPFTICAYNPRVMGAPDSTRRSFVKANLNEQMGGQPDDNVSPYELMIYKAVYNLSAGDLKRFCAPDENNQNGGEYYVPYVDTIRELGPDTSSNPVLTPHLDRHWHLPRFMPDLDDRNQDILENEIHMALIWGMLTGKIDQKRDNQEEGHTQIIYLPRTKGRERFVVSNGSPCDELYEVLDALSINPPQTAQILKDMEETMALERKEDLSLNQGVLMKCMNWSDERAVFGEEFEELEPEEKRRAEDNKFRVRQYAPSQKASMFDLIYWIKAKSPADEFDEEDVADMLSAAVRVLERYVELYTGRERVYRRCYLLLKDQFTLFLQNLRDEAIRRPRHRLYDPSVDVICDWLDDRIRNVYQVPASKRDIMRALYQEAVEAGHSVPAL